MIQIISLADNGENGSSLSFNSKLFFDHTFNTEGIIAILYMWEIYAYVKQDAAYWE